MSCKQLLIKMRDITRTIYYTNIVLYLWKIAYGAMETPEEKEVI